jgi:hypothetical protein
MAADSGHSRELALDLAIHRPLKAHQQLLVQHSCNPLKRRQLRYMGSLLQSRDGAMRSTRRSGDLSPG